jgi:hypothetical protein
MVEDVVRSNGVEAIAPRQHEGHRLWIRMCHWVFVTTVICLGATGFVILMVQPRLYWGEVGNDLTPAIVELPISNNYRPDRLQRTVLSASVPSTVSAYRTYPTFNQNSWARSLHFLAGWFLAITGLI